MPPRKPRQRIEIDTLFAPLPQSLLLDLRISAAAARLWGVLYVFRWNGDPPDFDALALAMHTTNRSVYRWLQELERAGWIDWDRHADLQDRFTLRTAPDGDKIDTSVKLEFANLIVRSKDLIVRSKDLIVGSEDLTQVSIFDAESGVSTRQNAPTQNHENHEKIQKDGVGGGHPLADALLRRGMQLKSVKEILDQHLDPDTVIQSLDNMLADGVARGHDPDNVIGRFVLRLRHSPPQKGEPYGRRAAQDRAERSAAAAGARPAAQRTDYDALLAEIQADNADLSV